MINPDRFTVERAVIVGMLITLALAVVVILRRPKEPDVQWIGNAVLGQVEDGGRYVRTSVIQSIEIGIKPNGLVVWREKPVKP